MSMASHPSRRNRSRVNSLQQEGRLRRDASFTRQKPISRDDAYSYALRSAYLSYLLQPRQKRLQHVSSAATPKPVHRSSAMDLLKDFSGVRDSKSNKFPHAFMGALDKRITGVLIGKERLPEYNDNLIKRSFGAFLNEFKNPVYRKTMERDRKMEDLLLIFYSNGVKELQKGKAPDDDGWKWMVERHLALFIRLISSILTDNDWARDKPELANRLQTLEKKLLMHDMDLSTNPSRNGGSGGQTIEMEVPLSYEVKDMPLVLTVSRIFETPYGQVQEDINNNKATWTEQAALQDLKMYQQSLSLQTKNTLSSEDFDTEEAYEAWKKHEVPEVSHLILNIMQSHPELAKTTGSTVPQLQGVSQQSDSGFDVARKLSELPEGSTTYGLDHPIDLSGLNIGDEGMRDGMEIPFTFVPPDQRAYYRVLVRETLLYDIKDHDHTPPDETEATATRLLSKKSIELLNELAARWRIPGFSRRVLFLDAVKELYQRKEIDLETVDAAFVYFKEPPQEVKKSYRKSVGVHDLTSDWTKWTMADYAMYQQCLAAIHDDILRDLYEVMMNAYAAKSPSYGMCMYVLSEHIYADDLFPKSAGDLDKFTAQLSAALREKANETYQTLLGKNIPDQSDKWEFFHVIQLGKEVVSLCQKIQKRYRKTPVIMGAKPLMVLVTEMLPALAEDARDLVARIMAMSKERGEEVSIQDGFDLYRELVEIRRVHGDVLPNVSFAFHIEGQLQDFVWRWIQATDENIVGWVEGAVKQDSFQMGSHPGANLDEERHSVSAVDVFRSFKQSKDQIVELDWDDEYQFAKFMTAISKAIGMGIARYCDLIDQKFSREMDRLTPEQEAALNRSRQEKWVQLAKDAWTNKEVVEPFQFLPESLVKLNNIEYATLHLDKLEQEINVDRCAEIIQKHERPNQATAKRAQKLEKYVFTIKIIEAEDLKACDMNGLSDPYVVIGDEFQKRLAKTRVIYSNLNPRWDETVDIVTQGPLNIVATIWDWDTLGDHDCVGRTSLKLDPSHFRDFLPREYWMDLDTQGRLLLRVSMEGERDDIQFYFGKAFRSLKRTEREMTRSITDKLSAYIRYILSRQRLRNLLSRGGMSVQNAFSYFQRNRAQTTPAAPVTVVEITNALKPLFTYFDENFAIMKQTLTDTAMIMVMTRLWKEVLLTIESLLVPPMSDKLSQQKPLDQQELDCVFKWLKLLFDFFHAVDEESGVANGVPIDILRSPKYHEILNLNFFYMQDTEDLIRTSESMASASAQRHQEQVARLNRLSAPTMLSPGGHAFGGAAGLVGTPMRRHKTVMLSRNLGTMRKAKEEKRKAAQAEPTDEYILRILRMRPEAERYLKDRARQKERLAAAQAAEAIVRQSLAGGGGRMVAGYKPVR